MTVPSSRTLSISWGNWYWHITLFSSSCMRDMRVLPCKLQLTVAYEIIRCINYCGFIFVWRVFENDNQSSHVIWCINWQQSSKTTRLDDKDIWIYFTAVLSLVKSRKSHGIAAKVTLNWGILATFLFKKKNKWIK